MKTTLNIDEKLLREAMAVSRVKTKTDAVELGLRELIRRHKFEQLASLGGTLKGRLRAPRRRRSS